MDTFDRPRPFWRQLAFLMWLSAACIGCVPPGKPDPADKPEMPDQILSFDKLFAANCAGCHGAQGDFGPAPPLNDPLFAAIVPVSVLQDVIQRGRPGTPMPAFAKEEGGMLTRQQIDVLVAGIESKRAKSHLAVEPPPYELTDTAGGRSTDERQRGERVFSAACAGCHGENGLGNEEGDVGPINSPPFLALISDQALRRYIITGRPDLGMPNFAESSGRPKDFQPLTPTEVDDLVALLASWRESDKQVSASDPASSPQQN